MREGSPAPALAILRAAKPLHRLLEQRGPNVWVLEKLDGPLVSSFMATAFLLKRCASFL